MIWLVWYLRSMFCKHDFEYKERQCQIEDKSGTRISATCVKCDWHRSYWKYL